MTTLQRPDRDATNAGAAAGTGVNQKDALRAYREYVEGIAQREDGETILNRSAEHASVIIEWIFRKATDSVKILTGSLNVRVYGPSEVVAAAVDFLKRNPAARLRILTEQGIVTNHPLLHAGEVAGLLDRIDVSHVPVQVQREYPYHFAVADGRHLRFEKSRDDMEAVVQFGGTGMGRQLDEAFTKLEARIA